MNFRDKQGIMKKNNGGLIGSSERQLCNISPIESEAISPVEELLQQNNLCCTRSIGDSKEVQKNSIRLNFKT